MSQEPVFGTFEHCEKYDGHVFKNGVTGWYCTDCLTEFDVTFTPKKQEPCDHPPDQIVTSGDGIVHCKKCGYTGY